MVGRWGVCPQFLAPKGGIPAGEFGIDEVGGPQRGEGGLGFCEVVGKQLRQFLGGGRGVVLGMPLLVGRGFPINFSFESHGISREGGGHKRSPPKVGPRFKPPLVY